MKTVKHLNNMKNKTNIENSILDINIDELKKFISSFHTSNTEEKAFKPERLKNLRDANFTRRYNSGLSN